MAIIKCPECGHNISDKAPFCPSCGVAIAGKTVTCPECGKVYFNDLAECPQCHHKTPCHMAAPKEVPAVADDNQERTVTNNEHVVSDGPADIQQHPDGENAVPAHNPSRNNKIVICVAVAVVAIVIGLSYFFYQNMQSDRELSAYNYAMSSNDPQVLQSYLDQYSDAPQEHIDSITAHLNMFKQIDTDWTNTLVSGSRNALEQYVLQHPDSPYKAVALHKIDSLDWVSAQQQNTVEAIEQYIENHSDGEYVNDANDAIKNLNAKVVQPEERQMISSIFNSFFKSLSDKDETALTSVVNPLLNKFLGKSNATKSDVVTFMHKIYKSDVASMSWQPLGDLEIDKKDIGEQQFEYTVKFTVLQSVTSQDNNTSNVKFKIYAKVNNDGRITELNMVKIID